MAGQVRLQPADPQGVARLVFSHPGKLNALSVQMWHELRAAMEQLAAMAAPPRVVVLQGEGGSFVAGADIEEFPGFRFDAGQLAHYHEQIVAPALHALLDCELPLIAQIEGACVGGGLEIAACCDLRLAAASSRFGIPIARLGFPMAPAEIEIVARVVGETTLRELLLEARVLDAEEARARGLVTRVLPDAQLAHHVSQAAARMALLSPQALRLNKRALRRFAAGPPSHAEERSPHYAYAPSPEHREGLAAFIERRPARFQPLDTPLDSTQAGPPTPPFPAP